MKWLKVNTVKQISEDGKWIIRKVFDRCFFIENLEDSNKSIEKHFDTLREAKKYFETR